MTLNEQIFERMGELSPAEKKVARTLLSSYPSAGLESAASLAKAAGTSSPTVLRLVSRLGIGSYPDFQHRLREEITSHMNSPVSRTKRATHDHDHGVLSEAIVSKVTLVDALTTSVPPSEFDRAVLALAAKPRHVVISGGYSTRYFAMLVATQPWDMTSVSTFAWVRALSPSSWISGATSFHRNRRQSLLNSTGRRSSSSLIRNCLPR